MVRGPALVAGAAAVAEPLAELVVGVSFGPQPEVTKAINVAARSRRRFISPVTANDRVGAIAKRKNPDG